MLLFSPVLIWVLSELKERKPCSWASAHYFPSPSPLLSPKVAFRCKISRHMERRSFSSPPKDSDCMTNHVHHHPPNPTQNLQTTASLEWKKEFLQLCRVKLRLLSLLNYSIVGERFKLLHSKPYGWFEHPQVMPSTRGALHLETEMHMAHFFIKKWICIDE